jgi:DNA replication and repair protein RecF
VPISRIRLYSFRNLEDGELSLASPRVFLVGENGQGKTNLLEAVYYLSYGSTFRSSSDAALARNGTQDFALEGWMGPSLDPGGLGERVTVTLKAKLKEIRREGKLLRDRKELIEGNPAIVYCHEDFGFASGEPERRRFFFDQTASLVSLGYLDSLRDYRKVLSQRNAALREGREDLLEVLDWQLASKGLELVRAREELAGAFAPGFSRIFEEVSRLGRAVAPVYRPNWKEGGGAELGSLVRAIAERRREELAMKTSLSGPHRDRWVFVSEGRDFAATASTGQLRLLTLVLRSSQASHYLAMTGRAPLLLLDDVLLELDPERRRRFFATLPTASQAIFTFLPGEDWEGYREADSLVYRVADGRFTHQVGA